MLSPEQEQLYGELLGLLDEARHGARVDQGSITLFNICPRLVAVATEGAEYLVEYRVSEHDLVTRFSERPLRVDVDGPQLPDAILIRKQGNIDRVLTIGSEMNILGIARVGVEFDPDSILTTSNITSVSFVQKTVQLE